MKVFVYGTLRKGSCRDGRLEGGRLPAVLKGFELHQMAGADFPYIAESPEGFVLGELVCVAPSEATEYLDRLDAIEGHPRFYTREEVNVIPLVETSPDLESRDRVEAWVYTMPEARQRDGGLIETGDFFDFPGNLRHSEREVSPGIFRRYKEAVLELPA